MTPNAAASPPPGTAADVATDYRARGDRFAARRDTLRREAERLSYARLAAFAVAATTALLAAGGRDPVRLFTAVAVVAGVAFIVLARRHGDRRRQAAWEESRRQACERGVARVARDWTALGDVPDRAPDRAHPYAPDLDVLGHASLERLTDVVSADPGRRTLLSWLLGSVPGVAELRARQEAVAELRPRAEWRETLAAHAWSTGSTRHADVERFLVWAEGEPWLTARPVLLWASRLVPVTIVASIAIAASGGGGAWWAVPLAAGLALTLHARRALYRRLTDATARVGGGGLAAQSAMLDHAGRSDFTAPRLVELRRRLGTGRGAAAELARLGGIVRWAEARYSPMAYMFLQLFLLWDFHVLAALERWQRDSGAHARDWLAALGEIEALGALATLGYENPEWCMPVLTDGGPAVIEGREVGHPLLADEVRVPNDVTVGPAGHFLLITGSNMSGKSTLLRAIGTNVVLAQAGGPVCARAFRLPVVELWTSIRIDDSLEAGISLFMAELRRLKRIVDAARAPGRDRPLLYLLDEMLHGTNTAERRIAARTVLGHLVRAAAIGAVTTHDLTMADDRSLDDVAARVHFTERFERRDGAMVMTFDYRLRPGLATSANALKLLDLVGLGE